jgi:hypothetical protein
MDKDDVKINVELEAEDTLAVRLKRLHAEGPPCQGPVRETLQRQSREVVKDWGYVDGELALIEVDGVSNAVQIRTKKPETQGKFVEVILRGGNAVDLEAKGGAVHLSRENYERLRDAAEKLVSE